MERESALNNIPSRIKYYLLDWKDKNMKDYILRHGVFSLHDLTTSQLYELFIWITDKDKAILRKKKN